ncbi:hypothetical protein VRU48_05405 [Pedobacter sp. KR3-3]|uniref:Uncharacterized protein n=1 Tax=Pedobacter albus TaxID=3113905 RepID=A0ABU7I4Z6_9SPHI|nr:hypothetical protein [Pedobacter sp. KR3-3]MEE1944535.1 hypothetical protein [Pedobacter sp. KR3-3]
MQYKNLGDRQIAFGNSYSCDVDDDGVKDFSIHTEYFGKPAERIDCQQFYFIGAFPTYSPVDLNEQTPLLNAGNLIGKNSYANHAWYNASHLLLSEKVITESGNDYWQGKWKDASHKYLAFAVKKDGKLYYGWLELSFSQSQGALILHRAAIAEQAEKDVFAGK